MKPLIHYHSKEHTRFKRKMDKEFKRKEAIKTLKYQERVDKIKKTIKKKGRGKYVKIKGEILPSWIDTNSRCSKSWTYVGYGKEKPLKEGFKHSIIFYLT